MEQYNKLPVYSRMGFTSTGILTVCLDELQLTMISQFSFIICFVDSPLKNKMNATFDFKVTDLWLLVELKEF